MIIIIIVAAFIWLILKYNKLRQELTVLRSDVERANKDIAGLCSAAVSVDRRLLDSGEKLKDIVEKVTDFEQHEQQTSQPYHTAIQRVRNGADAEELTQQCGLSRDEAVLLIRLHGNKS
mgnify:FL=1